MEDRRFVENLPDMMHPEDLMEFFQIGRNTMYQLLRSKEIPSIRIGKQYRIPKKLLLSYLAQECYDSSMEGSPDHKKGEVSR